MQTNFSKYKWYHVSYKAACNVCLIVVNITKCGTVAFHDLFHMSHINKRAESRDVKSAIDCCLFLSKHSCLVQPRHRLQYENFLLATSERLFVRTGQETPRRQCLHKQHFIYHPDHFVVNPLVKQKPKRKVELNNELTKPV